MSNYSPVSSAARAYRKGLPTMMNNLGDAIEARLPPVSRKKSKSVQYRQNLAKARALWAGSILMDITQPGRRRKDLSQTLIALDTSNGALRHNLYIDTTQP